MPTARRSALHLADGECPPFSFRADFRVPRLICPLGALIPRPRLSYAFSRRSQPRFDSPFRPTVAPSFDLAAIAILIPRLAPTVVPRLLVARAHWLEPHNWEPVLAPQSHSLRCFGCVIFIHYSHDHPTVGTSTVLRQHSSLRRYLPKSCAIKRKTVTGLEYDDGEASEEGLSASGDRRFMLLRNSSDTSFAQRVIVDRLNVEGIRKTIREENGLLGILSKAADQNRRVPRPLLDVYCSIIQKLDRRSSDLKSKLKAIVRFLERSFRWRIVDVYEITGSARDPARGVKENMQAEVNGST
ncbi:unnamed protein product [Cyclocybe aegerita]|uniref:Uncharacterized protein n=1 Tax=Cyclocybe aegerita TaxID=1973307 RepID=A0A8S0XXJ8_CYCAE|nr:unnamed protein product [Cyclocybe aegerita]